MGGDNTGLIGFLLHNVSEHPALGGDIQRRSCLIQQQHRRVTQHGAGNGNALGLAFREAAAPLPRFGVDGIRHFGHKIPGAGNFEGFNDFLVGGIFLDGTHILGNGTGKNGVALWYIGKKDGGFRHS